MENLSQKIENNPLVIPSTHKHEATPFTDIKVEHFQPAFQWAINEAQATIKNVAESTEEATFNNVVLPLETAPEAISRISSVFYNLLSCNTSDELQKLAPVFGPMLSDFSSSILLNDKLFIKVKALHEKQDTLNLNKEESKLLEKLYKDFVRNGALLDESKKEELKTIDQELSKLSPAFSENVLKSTNGFQLHLTDETKLAGLPESAIAGAKAAAEASQKEGWVFTLHYPSYVPFMKYADDRESRETLYKAFAQRAFDGELSNQENVKKFVALRQKRAELLGYNTHANFVLEERMAQSPEKVLEFLNKLYDSSIEPAKNDVAETQALADELNGPNPLQPWDFSYYAEKLKAKKYNFNSEEVRPYFQLEKVIDGAFAHANKLYGLSFKESNEYPKYHEEVLTYEVYEEATNRFIGLFYADFFPRDSKRAGAWMTSYRNQGLNGGEVKRPHISIVCNFTKPTKDTPSLLSLDEVRTLFHEFGHALHGLLSDCHFSSLGGTNVFWDFVELPSQVFENWILEKEGLDLFAKHYQTGEAIPEELTQKIKQSSQFQAGYMSIRQLTFGFLDMAWHYESKGQVEDVSEFETKATSKLQVLPKVAGTNTSCSFSHIFAGGYSAGYYSYKWAEVLDADAFELFKEKGLFDQETATSFKENILSKGGTEHPMDLYKKFRGREPDPNALLRRDGLI